MKKHPPEAAMNERVLSERFNLRSLLRFDPENANIWLDENRMLLLHTRALGALRKELFDSLGEERARGLLIRMGFVSGQQDAKLAKKMIGDGDPNAPFFLGPELHMLEGIVRSRLVRHELDVSAGKFDGELVWENSWEAESHRSFFGVADHPVCWSQIGYASGYVTEFLGRLVVFREVECAGCGHAACRIVGKPAEEWEDAEDYLRYFRPENIFGELEQLQEEVASLRATLVTERPQSDLIGVSEGFRAAFDLLQRAATCPITVMLLGETGVGKERFARWLHEHSERSEKPFIAINCAAIPNDLIEAELFGVEKGAYTGALQSRSGRFERADGGTLFLDEIGDLSLAAQVKLLRVLQTGELERLGDSQVRRVDVRLITATNVNLKQAISGGRFRADLYYRIAPYPVRIPPLRERTADIPLLIDALVSKYSGLYKKELRGFTDRAMQMLKRYPWPGNIRELENVIERGVLLAPPGGPIEIGNLFDDMDNAAETVGRELDGHGHVCSVQEGSERRLCEELLATPLDWNRHEKQVFAMAAAKAGGNLAEAARRLGITRRQLAYRLEQSDESGSAG
ncbi:MAG: sigma 54-interacting transcriptional regulator [Propionivibrio sp.]